MLLPISLALAGVSEPIDLNRICREACAAAITQFHEAPPREEHMSISVATLDREKGTWSQGSHRGDWRVYPASVVKAFYLAYAAHLKTEGRLALTQEHQRAFRDMIVDSSNDATGLVMDLITGTTGGPELPEAEMKEWMDRRQTVNRWFAARGYTGLNACQKTWAEGPYGREKIGYGPNMELRNMATSDHCVRLFVEIALGKIGDPASTDWMKSLLRRDLVKGDGQTRTLIGKVVPPDCEFYSKAGWAYEVRCDVAWIKTPGGEEFVICVMTDKNVKNLRLLPFLAERVLRSLGVGAGPERWPAEVEEPEEA